MTKENAKEFLPLVQALADGKTIQVLGKDGNWYDSKLINIPPRRYRIKPEPRTFEMWKNKNTGELRVTNFLCDFDDNAQWEHITVKEVVG